MFAKENVLITRHLSFRRVPPNTLGLWLKDSPRVPYVMTGKQRGTHDEWLPVSDHDGFSSGGISLTGTTSLYPLVPPSSTIMTPPSQHPPYICSHVGACLCVHVHMCTCTCEGWRTTLEVTVLFLRHGPSLAWNSPSRLGWPFNRPQGSSCLHFPQYWDYKHS